MFDSLVIVGIVGVGVTGFIALLMMFAANYIKAEPNEALIFTGRKYRMQVTDEDGTRTVTRGWRAIIGGAALRIPVIERVSRISLELMNLADVRVNEAYSKQGVPVSIEAVANVKISSNDQLLPRAVERFLDVPRDQIKRVIKETLEGQLRDIIGVMTVEELYQDRDNFVARVLDQAGKELEKIGVIIDIINIQDIRDEQGYLMALGVGRTAEVKRDAQIMSAEAARDATIKSENARREGEVVRAEQERLVAEAEKSRDVAKQDYAGEKLAAQRQAEQQGPLSEAKSRQEVVAEEQKVLEREQEARKLVEEAKAAAEEARYRAEVIVPAEAQKAAAIAKAEGEAEALLTMKRAEAEGIRAVLEGEAEGLRQKAEAWNQFGQAAQLNLSLEAFKEVAAASARTIGAVKFDKVVAIDGGGDGESSVARMLTAAPSGMLKFLEQTGAMLGVDFRGKVQELMANQADVTGGDRSTPAGAAEETVKLDETPKA